jgi:hypothetical protein
MLLTVLYSRMARDRYPLPAGKGMLSVCGCCWTRAREWMFRM